MPVENILQPLIFFGFIAAMVLGSQYFQGQRRAGSTRQSTLRSSRASRSRRNSWMPSCVAMGHPSPPVRFR